jgi:hypothetical protein
MSNRKRGAASTSTTTSTTSTTSTGVSGVDRAAKPSKRKRDAVKEDEFLSLSTTSDAPPQQQRKRKQPAQTVAPNDVNASNSHERSKTQSASDVKMLAVPDASNTRPSKLQKRVVVSDVHKEIEAISEARAEAKDKDKSAQKPPKPKRSRSKSIQDPTAALQQTRKAELVAAAQKYQRGEKKVSLSVCLIPSIPNHYNESVSQWASESVSEWVSVSNSHGCIVVLLIG